jgi:hypothetical protein
MLLYLNVFCAINLFPIIKRRFYFKNKCKILNIKILYLLLLKKFLMKKNYPLIATCLLCALFIFQSCQQNKKYPTLKTGKIKKKKTQEEKRVYSIERELYEFNLQKNPLTGLIPMEEKQQEMENTLSIKQQAQLSRRMSSSTYISRGPSNLGGRTRAFAVDLLDDTSNTMLSGGVSSGLFRTTNGGDSWTKVSANDEIYNVTALAQDPRVGHQNKWYYATGEWSGNSANLGANYLGNGVWKSIDNGLTWTQIAATNSTFNSFDNYFDFVNALEINPVSGDLLIATTGKIHRFDGTNLTIELELADGALGWTDVVIAANGRVFASLVGFGVWTSPTGNSDWIQIAENGTPANWEPTGRIVLGEAPSNTNAIYALYTNGNSGGIEADLWKYDLSTNLWTDYSSKLPDEEGGDSSGNDPFAVQGGYDLVVSVKADDENFVVIGGTNVYKIGDIVDDATFVRIGGYADNKGYSTYDVGGVEHHSDIHVLEFDPFNDAILFSGTDGGVHKTVDISASSIEWVSLNNNYITYQFFHVALDPTTGSDMVMGGAQDNGTKVGGVNATLGLNQLNNTSMKSVGSGDGVAVGIGKLNSSTQLYLGTQQGNLMRYNNNEWSYPKPEDSPTGNDALFITYFYLDPDNNDYLYYAGKPTLYKTKTANTVEADTWDNAGTLSTNENLRTFATTRGTYAAASSYMLLGGESGGIFRFDDPVNTANLNAAVNITPAAATASSGTVVSGLAIHPTNKDIVLAVYANYGIKSIFLTTNATADNPAWTLVEKNLSAHSIRSAAVTTVGDEIVYFVGTARGLYSNLDPVNDDWDLEGVNTIGLAVVSSLAYRPSDNKLLIGTHGNGMFDTTVQGTLATNDFSKTTDVFLYPNPTQKELNIQSNTFDFSKNVDYNISDITGKTVKKGMAKNKKINVENLNSGVYFIDLSVAGKKQNFKFIKN